LEMLLYPPGATACGSRSMKRVKSLLQDALGEEVGMHPNLLVCEKRKLHQGGFSPGLNAMLPPQNDKAQTPRLSGSVPLVRMLVQWQLISPIDLSHTQTGGLRIASGVIVDC
jgi:hypothetical protein